MNKGDVINKFELTKTQTNKIERFVLEIFEFNKHTNIIGKSTLENIWERHIADSLQLSFFISQKKSKVFDLGTGGGLPGIPLSVLGYDNVFMIDSVGKKIDFVRGGGSKALTTKGGEFARVADLKKDLKAGKADALSFNKALQQVQNTRKRTIK